ncbi:Fanconi anemia group F protein [Cololabis saira]|uniref:Fanconi anemia group F protein n=1 Tax=Cololabis saira TaxID=129043 RepID=UPI002AD59470|nr:Fanconi anemia group F protein [Cololabis saira]
MEALLRDVSGAAELLAAAAHGGGAARWDRPALHRAFTWAQYCEHVHARFQGNTAIRGALEKQLQITNQSLQAAFPECSLQVSFSDLRRCQQLLLSGLLSNPELPGSALNMLFETKEDPGVGVMDSEYEEDATGLCSYLIQCKSACKVLHALSSSSAVGADAEVQGEMLMERLAALLGQGGDLHRDRAQHLLHSVLQVFDGAVQHFCLVIAAALLTTKHSAAQTTARDFLLDWLQNQHGLLQCMCSELPSGLMRDLAREQQKCRGVFCSGLKKWASEMEYSMNGEGWVHSSTNPTLSFQKLVERFWALFEACPSLRVKTEDELNALKVSDGDFDVEGLSVWGDILSALNRQNLSSGVEEITKI